MSNYRYDNTVYMTEEDNLTLPFEASSSSVSQDYWLYSKDLDNANVLSSRKLKVNEKNEVVLSGLKAGCYMVYMPAN